MTDIDTSQDSSLWDAGRNLPAIIAMLGDTSNGSMSTHDVCDKAQWFAMDEDGGWYMFLAKPKVDTVEWWPGGNIPHSSYTYITTFMVERDWEECLFYIGEE